MDYSMPGLLSITNSQSLLKLMSIESVMPSNHLIFCRPLLLSPSIFPSIRVFSNESALCIRWPKYWSFSFNISPSNEHSGLISFRMGWFLRIAIVKSWLCDRHFIHQLCKHYLLTTAILWGIYYFLVLQMKRLRLKKLSCQNSYSL